jgi:preprotein translocase subunit SecE
VFERYKKEQGKWTRGLTMAGGLLVVALGAWWLYDVPVTSIANSLPLGNYAEAFKIGLATLFVLIGGYVTFWASYLNPGTGDFFIATEGEMKKVSWSSRKEILGSTWVVIVTLIAMGALLFVVDTVFMVLFWLVGVLKVANPTQFFTGGGA